MKIKHSTYQRIYFSGLLSSIFLYSIWRYSSDIRLGGNPYLTGDWLINYQGGFNGRGLFGEILFQFSQSFGINILWLTFLLQSLLLGLLFLNILQLFKSKLDFYSYLVLLNPAFILFYFLDTGGVFRKELLGLVAVTSLANYLSKKTDTIFLFILFFLTFILCIFSWDASFIFCPIIIILLRNSKISSKRHRLEKFFITQIVILFSVFALFRGVYFKFNRDLSQSKLICDSLMSLGVSEKVCQGTISSISDHPGIILGFFWTLIIEYDYWMYALLLIFSLIPFFFKSWLFRNGSHSIAIFLSSAPLFILGEDYGRWIHLIVFQLSILWCLKNEILIEASTFQLLNSRNSLTKMLKTFALFFYFSTWRIPVAMGNYTDSSYGLVARLYSWSIRILHLLSRLFY